MEPGRALRPRRRDDIFGVAPSSRNNRVAKGVYNGVAGVVEICARALARAARLDGDVM